MTIAHSERHYLPAAGHHWSLPLYDPLTRLLGVDRVRTRLLEQAGLVPGHRVLDVGCGTGSLAVALKRLHPEVEVVGLDPDPKALARARRKAERARIAIAFDEGFADALPYAAGSFDRAFSSFMFHHVPAEEKLGMLREIRRVLKPGGRLEMVDFAKSEHGGGGIVARILHSHHLMNDNTSERVLALMGDAGFTDAQRAGEAALLVGRVAFYQAARGVSG